MVRLRTGIGTVVFVGELRAGGRYEMSARQGDVRLQLRPAPFTVAARARRIVSGFALRDLDPGADDGPVRRAAYQGGGPLLDVSAERGELSLAPLRHPVGPATFAAW